MLHRLYLQLISAAFSLIIHYKTCSKKRNSCYKNHFNKLIYPQNHLYMESLIYRLSANFTYNEVYEIFLAENDIHVLDEILGYFISIQNYNACRAIKDLFKEKSLKN